MHAGLRFSWKWLNMFSEFIFTKECCLYSYIILIVLRNLFYNFNWFFFTKFKLNILLHPTFLNL